MSFFKTSLPPTYRQTITDLYSGKVFLLPGNRHSLSLVEEATIQLKKEFGTEDLPIEAHKLPGDQFFQKIKNLRRYFYCDSFYHQKITETIRSLDFPLEQTSFDPARIRVVKHEGHMEKAAAPIYYGHRDTWYGNSQSMITWWIPIVDVHCENSFEFFPSYFDREVRNDSEVFHFERWTSKGDEKKIGWQNKRTGLEEKYPQLLVEPNEQGIPVECNSGDILLFSAQHLHRTIKNVTHRTRYSFDFRTVDMSDHQRNIGAVNVDNRSKGDSSTEFVHGRDFTQ